VLPGGIPGTPAARVAVVGGGVAGEHAAANALGLGARVTILDIAIPRLNDLDRRFGGRAETLVSDCDRIAWAVAEADLVIGSVLVPGARAPKLVTAEMVERMRPGSVLVDIAIDQGGCFEGSRPTTHAAPVYPVGNVTYYCVANMPGAVARTSTLALTSATLPYVRSLAELGWRGALEADPALAKGLNTASGRIVNPAVAAAFATA
jgi:alanine dehydrogenase